MDFRDEDGEEFYALIREFMDELEDEEVIEGHTYFDMAFAEEFQVRAKKSDFNKSLIGKFLRIENMKDRNLLISEMRLNPKKHKVDIFLVPPFQSILIDLEKSGVKPQDLRFKYL